MSGMPTVEKTLRAGEDPANGVQQTRQTYQYLGKATAVDTTLLGRPCLVHSLTCSNPTATAFEIYVGDATSGAGADSNSPRYAVPANSCLTHVVDREHYIGVRIRGAAAFPAGAEISAVGA
jgi:hypothetical protein